MLAMLAALVPHAKRKPRKTGKIHPANRFPESSIADLRQKDCPSLFIGSSNKKTILLSYALHVLYMEIRNWDKENIFNI